MWMTSWEIWRRRRGFRATRRWRIRSKAFRSWRRSWTMWRASRCKNWRRWFRGLMLRWRTRNRSLLLRSNVWEPCAISSPRSRSSTTSANETTSRCSRTWTRRRSALTRTWAATWKSTKRASQDSTRTTFRRTSTRPSRRDSPMRQSIWLILASDFHPSLSPTRSSLMPR